MFGVLDPTKCLLNQPSDSIAGSVLTDSHDPDPDT